MSASRPSSRQHPSYGDCLEVKREYCQNCFVLGCVHNVHSQQHTYKSSSYRSSRLGLSHWDPYAVHRGGCLELYYCNMVEWSWWDSGLVFKTNWFPSVLWHCWFGHMICKDRPHVKPWTLIGNPMLKSNPPFGIAVWPLEVAEMAFALKTLDRQYLHNEDRMVTIKHE